MSQSMDAGDRYVRGRQGADGGGVAWVCQTSDLSGAGSLGTPLKNGAICPYVSPCPGLYVSQNHRVRSAVRESVAPSSPRRSNPRQGLGGRTPHEVYFHCTPANEKRRYEPRGGWSRRSSGAAPQAKEKGRRGVRLDLRIS
jgi:hypothetical protein